MRLKAGRFETEFQIPVFSVPAFLAIALVFGFFVLMGKIALYEVPAGSKEIVFAMVGSMSTWVGLIVGFYYGSSAGSARKTELLKTETPKP